MGKRGPKPTLSDRDKQVLCDLYYARCMTGLQLQESVYGGESQHGKRRLRFLIERNLISRIPYAVSQFDKTSSFNFSGYVYQLTDAGVWETEQILGERILSQDNPDKPLLGSITPRSESIGRYLETAKVYITTKGKVDWIPHFLIRHRIQSPDFTVACLAAAQKNDELVILFGVNKSPHLNTFKVFGFHMKNSSGYGIKKYILMCPDDGTVGTAIEYYRKNQFTGELHVMTYENAHEELPFVFGGFLNELYTEVRRLFPSTERRQPQGYTAFDSVIEYVPGKYAYLIDLSTGNLNQLYSLLVYTWSLAKQEGRYQESNRVVFVMVRDRAHFDSIQPLLENHLHVRFCLRKSEIDKKTWVGMNSNGEWVVME